MLTTGVKCGTIGYSQVACRAISQDYKWLRKWSRRKVIAMARTKKIIVLDVPKDSSKHERQEHLKIVRTDESGEIVPVDSGVPEEKIKADLEQPVKTPKVKTVKEKRVIAPKVKLTAKCFQGMHAEM